MSVSLVSQPQALTPVENGLVYVLSLDDIGTPPEIKSMVYKLSGTGGEIYKDGGSSPVAGSKFRLDFRSQLRGLIKTALPPTTGGLGVYNDSTFIQTFDLEYGTQTVNTDTKTSTYAANGTVSGKKVFNGAINIYDTSFINSVSPNILSWRPKKYNLLRTGIDFIWHLSSTSVQYKVYYANGAQQNITQSAPYDVNIVPIGLPFLVAYGLSQPADNVKAFDITIGTTVYNVSFESICDEDPNQEQTYMEVLFLEPLGGRSVMPFQEYEGGGIQRSQTNVKLNKNETTISEVRSNGEKTIDSKAFGTFTMRRNLVGDPDEVRWANALLASNEVHLLLKDRSGARFWAEVTDLSGSVSLTNKTMDFSCRLASATKTPYAI